MSRFYEFIVGFLCVLLGGLCTYTGLAMTIGMLIDKQSHANNLFWVGLITLFVAPPIFLAGFQLILNKPNKQGGLFSTFTLRSMAILNGVIGGMIIILAIMDSNPIGIAGGVSFLITTQGAFMIANHRDKSN